MQQNMEYDMPHEVGKQFVSLLLFFEKWRSAIFLDGYIFVGTLLASYKKQKANCAEKR